MATIYLYSYHPATVHGLFKLKLASIQKVYFSLIYMKTHVTRTRGLSSFPTDPPSQLDVFGHDGDPLSMDGAEVGVLKESHKVGLAGLLKSHHSRTLESQVSLEILSNLTDQPLERQLADQQLSGLLVPGKCHAVTGHP